MASDGPDTRSVDALAAQFPPPDPEAWLAIVRRTLNDAPLASLTRRTIEGIPIEPLYEPAHAPEIIARHLAGWDIRTRVCAPVPAAANAEALADLSGGADSLLLKFGAEGIRAADPAALARTLEGVLLDAAPVALDAGFAGLRAAEQLASLAKGAPAARLAFNLDPIGAFAEAGASPGPIAAHVARTAEWAAKTIETYPRASINLASGRAAHEAGAGEAAELAMALAAAIAYAKALERAGVPRQEAAGRIVLGLSADADCFLSVAKLRAARVCWSRLAGALGSPAPATIELASSSRMLTVADPWTNMIRLTAAAFAGAVGGADAVVLGAFTDAIGPPSAFARRQSRNIQLVLREEAGLGRVTDPGAGSGALEAVTENLARRAWALLQEIEPAGGLIAALKAGLVAGWAESGKVELARRLKERELRILGVTAHPSTDDHPVLPGEASQAESNTTPTPSIALAWEETGPDDACPPLRPLRLETLA
jgi:methylmalonyl-CoA mutase